MVDIKEVDDNNDEQSQNKRIQEVIKKQQKKTYIKYTDIHKDNEEEQSGNTGVGELYQIVAIVFGAICYFMKLKWAAWATLYFFYCSVINFGHHTMMS